MTAASIGLLFEGCMYSAEASLPAWVRAGLGAVLGVGFILATKWFLGKYDDEWALNGITGANASKMLLIMGVMTLHSLAEGVGIGVAFAGQTGSKFGIFISATLAIHNVPEGLAVRVCVGHCASASAVVLTLCVLLIITDLFGGHSTWNSVADGGAVGGVVKLATAHHGSACLR